MTEHIDFKPGGIIAGYNDWTPELNQRFAMELLHPGLVERDSIPFYFGDGHVTTAMVIDVSIPDQSDPEKVRVLFAIVDRRRDE